LHFPSRGLSDGSDHPALNNPEGQWRWTPVSDRLSTGLSGQDPQQPRSCHRIAAALA
jgi:hypothetical protein